MIRGTRAGLNSISLEIGVKTFMDSPYLNKGPGSIVSNR